MKRKLLGTSMAVAVLLVASSATAAGLNLAWSNCRGEGGTVNRTFACGSNVGANVLTCSFILAAGIPEATGNEPLVDIISTSNPIPQWWEFRDAGTCRQNALSFNTVADINNLVCFDWASGQAGGGIGYYGSELGTIDPGLVNQHRRLKAAIAVPSESPMALTANNEYFSINFVINNTKTVGTGACTGCLEPVCIVLNSIIVTTPVEANNVFLGSPDTPGSNQVTWQGPGPDCQLVPTRNKTWGSVKALYR